MTIERTWILIVGLAAVVSCGGDGAQNADGSPPPDSPAPGAPAAAGDSVASSASLGAHTAAELDSTARQIVGFLRGEVGFDRIRVADSVTLHVSPEGGGTRTPFARQELRDRASWRVRGQGRATYSFAPRPNMSRLETRVGRHLNCREYALSSRSPDLARLPHVGTKLEPADGSSCLQTWNVTFVFDPTEKPPTLVAALYDQWEW